MILTNIRLIYKVNLFDDNKTWIKSYIIKHGIDKEKLYDILNGNFSHENYPGISYWKTHHFKLFIESINEQF